MEIYFFLHPSIPALLSASSESCWVLDFYLDLLSSPSIHVLLNLVFLLLCRLDSCHAYHHKKPTPWYFQFVLVSVNSIILVYKHWQNSISLWSYYCSWWTCSSYLLKRSIFQFWRSMWCILCKNFLIRSSFLFHLSHPYRNSPFSTKIFFSLLLRKYLKSSKHEWWLVKHQNQKGWIWTGVNESEIPE